MEITQLYANSHVFFWFTPLLESRLQLEIFGFLDWCFGKFLYWVGRQGCGWESQGPGPLRLRCSEFFSWKSLGFWIGALGNFSTGSEGRGVARSPQGPGPLRLRCSEFLSWSLRNVTLFQAPLLLRGKLAFLGPPSWLSGKESACRCRRHGFDPWFWKIPRAAKQLGLCATY